MLILFSLTASEADDPVGTPSRQRAAGKYNDGRGPWGMRWCTTWVRSC